jgi:hypothetical protein
VNPNADVARKFNIPIRRSVATFQPPVKRELPRSALQNKGLCINGLAGSRLRSCWVLKVRKVLKAALLMVVAAFVLQPASAQAAVEISFYSKEFGASFPHAFVALDGALDETGEKIHANYGFTATHVSPAVLMGSVKGEVMSVDADYRSKSDRHFTITLTDEEYRKVMATVEQWRTLKQPSYNLNRQNCVYFVARVAAVLGMKAETPKALMKKPRSYIQSLKQANQLWLEQRAARLAQR